MARSIFDVYDAQANQDEDELPCFYLPQGYGGVLPGDLLYYNIKTTNPLIFSPNAPEEKNRPTLTCDNLDDHHQGHFIQFTFNSIGLVDSVTYMGKEPVVVQSLWSFVGLHESYLNELTSRYEQGIIPNVTEFLSENWAIALYHEWFGDFCLRMRQSVQSMAEVQGILEQAFEASKHGEGITREQMADFRKRLDPKTVRIIQDETLEFIKTNMNHLPMYYIPMREFD